LARRQEDGVAQHGGGHELAGPVSDLDALTIDELAFEHRLCGELARRFDGLAAGSHVVGELASFLVLAGRVGLSDVEEIPGHFALLGPSQKRNGGKSLRFPGNRADALSRVEQFREQLRIDPTPAFTH
jgi:hypothetical protein